MDLPQYDEDYEDDYPKIEFYEKTPAHLTTGAVRKAEEIRSRLKEAKARLQTLTQQMRDERIECENDMMYPIDEDEYED